MSDENPFDETTDAADGSFVELTIKGGTYQSHVVTVRKPTLDEVEDQMPAAIKAVVGAQASLERAIRDEKASPEPAKPGTLGKPASASEPSASELPFADSAAPAEDKTRCKHGERKVQLYQGKTYYSCGSDLPKESPDRCAVIEG